MTKKSKGYAITKQTLPKDLAPLVEVIHNIDQLPDEGCAFVVLDFDDMSAMEQLRQLRAKPIYQFLAVFYLGMPPIHHEQILDGPFAKENLGRGKSILDRLQLIEHLTQLRITDFERATVGYLFVREHFILRGFLDYHSTTGFQYPLLEILGFHEEAQHYWYMLQSMESRKLLKHETLVDEIQTCPHCKSGLLNFKNCCPNCNSVHITTQSFVHCFSCGNVGPLSEFLQQDELVCNRCHVKLRHIGIDYDKPMEDKICQDCHHFFFETNTNAVCMVCESLSDPADLQSKRLYEYRLARRGESLAKGIEQHLVVELGQFLKLIDLSIFMMIIKWQIFIAQRYDALSFSLLAIKISNEDDLIATEGSLKTEKILMEFFERVRDLLRSTDLVSRDNKIILFFLPMTPMDGCNIILERIQALTNDESKNENQIKIIGGMISSSEIIQNKIAADLLLAELYNRVNEHD